MAVSRLVLGALGIGVLAAAAAAGTIALDQDQADHFLGLRLGMTEVEAVAHMDRIAPGALVGQQCTGGYGVGSYIKYNGLDWQIMAHTVEGHVREIRLFRYEIAGTRTTAQCLAHYEILLKQQRAAYPDVTWRETSGSSDRFSVQAHAQTILPEATTIELTVERLDWAQARCAMELLISRSTERESAAR